LFVIHILIFTILLRQFPEWPLPWFLPTCILELIPMGFVIEKLVDEAETN